MTPDPVFILVMLIIGILGILWMVLGFTLFMIACVRQAKEDVGVARRNERERNEALGRKP